MTLPFLDRCDHPEDMRVPLPYDGKPARSDEWECALCGLGNYVLDDDEVAEAEADVLTPIALGHDWWDAKLPVMPVMTSISLAELESASAPSFTSRTPVDVLRDVGATLGTKSDGTRTITLDLSARPAPERRSLVQAAVQATYAVATAKASPTTFGPRTRLDLVDGAGSAGPRSLSEFEGLVVGLADLLHATHGLEWAMHRETYAQLLAADAAGYPPPGAVVQAIGYPVFPDDSIPRGAVALRLTL